MAARRTAPQLPAETLLPSPQQQQLRASELAQYRLLLSEEQYDSPQMGATGGCSEHPQARGMAAGGGAGGGLRGQQARVSLSGGRLLLPAIGPGAEGDAGLGCLRASGVELRPPWLGLAAQDASSSGTAGGAGEGAAVGAS
jgi:hypothetical protein